MCSRPSSSFVEDSLGFGFACSFCLDTSGPPCLYSGSGILLCFAIGSGSSFFPDTHCDVQGHDDRKGSDLGSSAGTPIVEIRSDVTTESAICQKHAPIVSVSACATVLGRRISRT